MHHSHKFLPTLDANDPDFPRQRLRGRAARLLAIALDAREIDPVYADKLVAEAVELQEQAKAIEEGDSRRPESSNREETSEERQTPVIDSPAQQPAQQQQQIQPKNNDNPKKG